VYLGNKRWVAAGTVLAVVAGFAAVVRWQLPAFEPTLLESTVLFQLVLGATIVALLRNEVGISTFGVFGPVIIAFAWVTVGPVWGLIIVGYVFMVALAARLAVGTLDLGTSHRVALLLVLVGVSFAVVRSFATLQGLPQFGTALLFPVILTTWYGERFGNELSEFGWASASNRLLWTGLTVGIVYLVASFDALVRFVATTPESWVLLVGLHLVLGSWNPVRLSEYTRFRTLRQSLSAGGGTDVLTMRVRNREFVSRYNPRSLLAAFPKHEMKSTLHGLDIPTPETYCTVSSPGEIGAFEAVLDERDAFVVKPADGHGGEGVLVVTGRDDDGAYVTSRGALTREDLLRWVTDVSNGRYSRGYDTTATVLVEAVVVPDTVLGTLAGSGVPDLRVVVLEGVPVMAMVRLPTEASRGTANLHQGAVGVAVDLATGRTSQGYQQTQDRWLDRHPDTGATLAAVEIPDWEAVLTLASESAIGSGLGYAGVDIVFDAERGPVVLEVNRRPGLGIQNVNMAGLLARLRFVEARLGRLAMVPAAARVAQAMTWARTEWTHHSGAVPTDPGAGDRVPEVRPDAE